MLAAASASIPTRKERNPSPQHQKPALRQYRPQTSYRNEPRGATQTNNIWNHPFWFAIVQQTKLETPTADRLRCTASRLRSSEGRSPNDSPAPQNSNRLV